MARRVRAEWVERFRSAIQRAIGCFADVSVYMAPASGQEDVRVLLHRPAPAVLQPTDGLGITVEQYVRVGDPRASWPITTVGYNYSFWGLERAQEEGPREFFAYHFHPLLTPEMPLAHLHVRWPESINGRPVSRAHFQTGPMAVEDFLRVLHRDFGVRPLKRHADPRRAAEYFEAVLTETRKLHD